MRYGTGFGHSKKESQQLAAKEAMRHIRKKDELYKNAVERYEERSHSSHKDERQRGTFRSLKAMIALLAMPMRDEHWSATKEASASPRSAACSLL